MKSVGLYCISEVGSHTAVSFRCVELRTKSCRRLDIYGVPQNLTQASFLCVFVLAFFPFIASVFLLLSVSSISSFCSFFLLSLFINPFFFVLFLLSFPFCHLLPVLNAIILPFLSFSLSFFTYLSYFLTLLRLSPSCSCPSFCRFSFFLPSFSCVMPFPFLKTLSL